MKWLYVLGLAYSLLLTLVYGVIQQSPAFMQVFTNVLFPATAGVTAIFSFLTLKKYGWTMKAQFFKIWLGFSLGIFMWFIGELTWAVYVLYINASPYPSPADGFYLGGYAFLFLALTLFFKMFRSGFSKFMLLETVLVTSLLALIVANSLFLPIAASNEDAVTLALDVAYPSLDIVLFFLAFAILLIFLKGEVGKAWSFLTLGVILNVVADLMFSFAELQGFYYEGHPFELFWLWGYMAFLLGFYIHKKEF